MSRASLFRRVTKCIALALVVAIGSGNELAVLADTISLSVAKGPGAGEVTLTWSGGTAPFGVFRGAPAVSVLDPANRQATTAGSTHVDLPPASGLSFYTVVGQGPPEIQSIAPAGASFGAKIAIYGQNFGTDPSVVAVRFSYTDGPSGETLTIDQDVFAANDTRVDVMVPFAVPNRTNAVQVVVAGVPSAPVPYFVGALPLDPTPGTAGDQTAELIDALDALLATLDTKLDPWFVQTGILSPWDLFTGFGQDVADMRNAIAQMRDGLLASSASDLAVTDCIIATPAFQDILQRVRAAEAALHGSPLGSIMCEGRDLRDVLLDIVNVLNVVDQILSAVSTAMNTACGLSVIAAIFTAGAASPLAVAICSAAAAVETIVRPIISAIETVAAGLDAIVSAAPVDPLAGSLAATTLHPLWQDRPPVVYVEGSIPVEGRLTLSFHNAACSPSGCARTFDITIYGIDIPIDISIPHITVPALPVTCSIDGPGSPAYTDLGSVDDGEVCRFTGADFGTGWVRGTHAVGLQTTCGGEVLGPATESYLLVSGPRLFSVSPTSGQIRDTLELHGQYMPPHAAGAPSKAAALFGDIDQPMVATEDDHYTLAVGDTDNLTGTIGLRVQGRLADQALPFTVLPPVLNFARIDPGFVGEEVELHGTGFAVDPSRNVLTLGAQVVAVSRPEPYGLVFRIPAGAASGSLQLTAAGHVSNPISFGVLAWGDSPGVRLSHPDRNAYHPVVAAHDDGTVGVAWIDRHAGGGELRLLFTDAAPTDTGFRAPVVIAPSAPDSELAGPPSAPPSPDVAIGPDQVFHVVWANQFGEVLLASIPKGGTPSSPVVAMYANSGFLRDPAIAVMADGTIHVAATDVPYNGDIHNALLHAISTDGGETFSDPVEFSAPGAGSHNDDLQIGEVDLTVAGGLLFRSWTQYRSYVDLNHGETHHREVFTQSSSDGTNWSSPQGASAGKIDVLHAGAPTGSRNAPSVSGDATGAVVAWDTATSAAYNPDGPTAIWTSREIDVNAEPYQQTTLGRVTPPSVGNQTDVGHASLVHHSPGGSPMTAIASVRRVPGSSPDNLAGVPRVHVRRFPFRDFVNPTLFETTPTVLDGDTTAQDASPSLAVDAEQHYHLAWLQGPEGHRVVRYQTTRDLSWPDTDPDDPPMTPAAPRDVIVVKSGANYDDQGALYHSGTLLVTPGFPEETRWVGVAPLPNNSSAQGRPAITPGGTIAYFGTANLHSASVCSLGGDVRVAGLDDPASLLYMNYLHFPSIDDAGRIYGVSYQFDPGTGVVNNALLRSVPGSTAFERLGTIATSFSTQEYAPSHSGNYVAYLGGKGELFVYDVASDVELPVPGAEGGGVTAMEWSPVADRVAFVTYAPCSFNPAFSCNLVGEWVPGGGPLPPRAEAEAIYQPSYRGDGTEIVYRCEGQGCCDPTALYPESAICTTTGEMVPRLAGAVDTNPMWSPDGTAIAFIRYHAGANPRGWLKRWTIGGLDSTLLTGPVLGMMESFGAYDATWRRIPQ